jgi:uncharacterized membrane protein
VAAGVIGLAIASDTIGIGPVSAFENFLVAMVAAPILATVVFRVQAKSQARRTSRNFS